MDKRSKRSKRFVKKNKAKSLVKKKSGCKKKMLAAGLSGALFTFIVMKIYYYFTRTIINSVDNNKLRPNLTKFNSIFDDTNTKLVKNGSGPDFIAHILSSELNSDQAAGVTAIDNAFKNPNVVDSMGPKNASIINTLVNNSWIILYSGEYTGVQKIQYFIYACQSALDRYNNPGPESTVTIEEEV